MKILVTGGAGFIGSNFIRAFLEQRRFNNSNVLLFDAMTYAGNQKTVDELLLDKRVNFVKEAKIIFAFDRRVIENFLDIK